MSDRIVLAINRWRDRTATRLRATRRLDLLTASIFLLVTLGCAAPAVAWGPEGHPLIARIAADRLTPRARYQVEALIGSPASETLAAVSNWADEVRPNRPETAPWHYVNIELGSSGYVAARDCPQHNCVVAQVVHEEAELADNTLSRADRAEALKFLVHFVGDIHQPFHCADNHDRGGNEVQVETPDGATNLHAVWDTDEVQALGPDPKAVSARLERQISAREATAWAKGSPADWANQSFVIARDRIYRTLPRAAETGIVLLSTHAIRAESGIAALQLKRAGVRLAAVLNRAFDQAGKPVQISDEGRGPMKHTAAALAVIGTMAPAIAAPISVSELQSLIGQSVTVEGVVSEVHTARSGVTFLDFGGHYPNQKFTGVIFQESAGAFHDVQSLSGRTVDVTGTVKLYHGKPEIILRSAGQLKAK